MCDSNHGAGREGHSPDRPSSKDLDSCQRYGPRGAKSSKRRQKRVERWGPAAWLKHRWYGMKAGNCFVGMPLTQYIPCLGCVPEKHPCGTPWGW